MVVRSESVTNEAVLLTVAQVARTLQISPDLVYELIRRKELPSVRLGRVIRVHRSALDQWIAARSAIA